MPLRVNQINICAFFWCLLLNEVIIPQPLIWLLLHWSIQFTITNWLNFCFMSLKYCSLVSSFMFWMYSWFYCTINSKIIISYHTMQILAGFLCCLGLLYIIYHFFFLNSIQTRTDWLGLILQNITIKWRRTGGTCTPFCAPKSHRELNTATLKTSKSSFTRFLR